MITPDKGKKDGTATGNRTLFNKTISYTPVGTDSQKIKLPATLPLTCLQLKSGTWSQVPLPKRATLTIDDSRESDVKLSQVSDGKTHVLIKEYGKFWFILNVNRKNEMKVNGLLKNQCVLPPGAGCHALLGVDQFMFFAKKPPSHEKAEQVEEPVNTPRAVSGHSYSLEFKGNKHPFPIDSSATLGKHAINELRFEGEEFEGIVFPRQKVLYFFPLTSQGVNIDGAPVSTAMPIKDQTKLTKDNVKITVFVPEELSAEPKEPSKNFSLIQLNENNDISRIIMMPPADRSANLGRTEENDIVVKHHRISRTHAQFIVYENSILLMDSHSTNGTYFNGQQINRKRCYPGDVISFADQKFIVGYVD